MPNILICGYWRNGIHNHLTMIYENIDDGNAGLSKKPIPTFETRISFFQSCAYVFRDENEKWKHCQRHNGPRVLTL